MSDKVDVLITVHKDVASISIYAGHAEATKYLNQLIQKLREQGVAITAAQEIPCG